MPIMTLGTEVYVQMFRSGGQSDAKFPVFSSQKGLEERLELGTFRFENKYISHHANTIVIARTWRLLLVYIVITPPRKDSIWVLFDLKASILATTSKRSSSRGDNYWFISISNRHRCKSEWAWGYNICSTTGVTEMTVQHIEAEEETWCHHFQLEVHQHAMETSRLT
ncbi:hypothetical protein TNCV_3507751 [Trichonephila clavipes]|uniref:Uncharacterized protein n=1 Tax=Trichonephila clavipes TaxID=2585209 RepID=A0A8X6S1K4_TRICX|nr:hypothetical protein TNCV_3507751 [Trichonephila clavipes]